MDFACEFAWARGEVSPSASKASRSTNAKSGKHTNPLTVTLNMFQKLYRYAMPVLKTSRFRHLFRFVAFSAYPLCGLKRRPQHLLKLICVTIKNPASFRRKLGEQAQLATNAPKLINVSNKNPRVTK